MTREVMEQALEALEKTQVEGYNLPGTAIRKAITAIKEALAQPPPECEAINNIIAEYGLQAIDFVADWKAAQPEQEPVACRFCHSKKGCWTWQCYHCGEIDDVQKPTPLAAQRPWQGLTEFQFAEIYNKWNDTNGSTPWGLNQALEAKLRKLNK